MINLMNVAVAQEGANTVQPVSTVLHGVHGPPEAQGLFAMLLEALCMSAQPDTGDSPVPDGPSAQPDTGSGPIGVSTEAGDSPVPDGVSVESAVADVVLPATQSAVEPADSTTNESMPGLPPGDGEQSAYPIDAPLPGPGQIVAAAAGLQTGGDQPVLSTGTLPGEDVVQPVPVQVPGDGAAVERPLTAGGGHIPVAHGRQSAVVSTGQTHAGPASEQVSPELTRPTGAVSGAAVRPGEAAGGADRPAELAAGPDELFRPHLTVQHRPTDASEPVSGRVVKTLSPPVQACARPGGSGPSVRTVTVTHPWPGSGVRTEPTSTSAGTGSQTNSSSGDGGSVLGSRYTGVPLADRDSAAAVPSRPTPIIETVGAAHPELAGTVKDRFAANHRTAAGNVIFAMRSAGRGSAEPIARAAPVREPAGAQPLTVGQVVKVVRKLIGEHRSEMRVRLWPPHLGELEVRVVHEADSLRVELVAESSLARNLLEARLPELRYALSEFRGPGTDVSVTVTTNGQPMLSAFTAGHGEPHTPYDQGGEPHGVPYESPGSGQPAESGMERPAPNVAVAAGHIDVRA